MSGGAELCCHRINKQLDFLACSRSSPPALTVGRRNAAFVYGERGRTRTCDPCLKRAAKPHANNNLHVQLTPYTTQ